MDLCPKSLAIVALTLPSLPGLAFAQPENFDDLKEVEVEIYAPDSSPTGAPLRADITIRNLEKTARKFSCYVHVHAVANQGDDLGTIVGPITYPLTIPAGGQIVIKSDAPWDKIQPVINGTPFIEYQVVLTRLHDDKLWFERAHLVVEGLPLTVELSPANKLLIGREAMATVTYSNPLEVPIHNVTLVIWESGLPINGTEHEQRLRLGTLEPHTLGRITRKVVASEDGECAFVAKFLADGLIPGDASAYVNVVTSLCPGEDFNADGLIAADSDIDAFLRCLTGDCCQTCGSTDLNADGEPGTDADIETFFNLLSGGNC